MSPERTTATREQAAQETAPSLHRRRELPESSPMSLLHAAAREPSGALPPELRGRLEQRLGADFASVRLHDGPASAAVAEHLGARAYTLGRDVYLGSDTRILGITDRAALLAHEAIHAVQQGGHVVAPHAGLRVSSPGDAAEVEARRLAARVITPPSPSLALRDAARVDIRQSVAPHIQRDLKGPHKAIDGTFNLNLKTESHPGAKSGMSGTIKFLAKDTAPDSPSIRLVQIAKLVDSSTGKDYVWSGDEANRNKVMTAKSTGVTEGFFVDVLHKNRSPRTAKTDAPVSPYYIDDYKAHGSPNNKDGSKKGKSITEASLWDYPGWNQNSQFSFETVAKAADTGYVYAAIRWGFTISDAAKGTVSAEHATLSQTSSLTFDSAVSKFNEFYKNPGSTTAPK